MGNFLQNSKLVMLAWAALAAAPGFADDGLGSSASSVGINQINIPCGAGNTVNGSSGLRKCEVVRPIVKGNVTTRVGQQMDSWYNGCDWDPSLPMPADGSCQGRKVPTGTCDTFANGVPPTFNKRAEVDTNHIGQSCGSFMSFRTHTREGACDIYPMRPAHPRESSYEQGGFVEAVNCYHQQVQNEIDRGTLKLSMSMDGKTPGPCALMGPKVQSNFNQIEIQAKKLEAAHSGQANVADVDNCTDDVAAGKQQDSASMLRNGACQLAAARASLEAIFSQVAVCEVFFRAQLSYVRFAGTKPQTDDITKAALQAINGIESNHTSCDAMKVQQRYNNAFMDHLTASANSLWNANTCK